MATSKPLSSVSYNTEEFLHSKLEEWYKDHIIQAYMYIKHIGEDGDKDHIHFRIEPNCRLDPMSLNEELVEPVDGNKPLRSRPFRPSKEEDWFLYVVHDVTYLKIKYGLDNEREKLPYNWEDIKVSDGYDLDIAVIRAKQSMKHTSANLCERIMNGENVSTMIQQGENVGLINAVKYALQDNDYIRLVKNNNLLQKKIDMIEDLLSRNNLKIDYDDNTNMILKEINVNE